MHVYKYIYIYISKCFATSATVLVQGFRLFGCSAVRRHNCSAAVRRFGGSAVRLFGCFVVRLLQRLLVVQRCHAWAAGWLIMYFSKAFWSPVYIHFYFWSNESDVTKKWVMGGTHGKQCRFTARNLCFRESFPHRNEGSLGNDK
jgi:hypothetical protein